MLWIKDFKKLLIMVHFKESCSAFNNAIAISSYAVEFVHTHRRLEKWSTQVESALTVARVLVEIWIDIAFFLF